ncbi:MAG: aminoacyl-tRNA hydrolase [Bacillota bacterium]
MHLIVGLGNPGREYAGTRHNMGFRLVDLLAEKMGAPVNKSMFGALTGRGVLEGRTVTLAKPQTYMNLSGESVAGLVNWFKIPISSLVVAVDDIDLPPGRIRIRPRGGDGGHRGLKSIIERLGTGDFARIRIGVGRPEHPDYEVTDWVLGRFSEEEERLAARALETAVEALAVLVGEGVESAMNRYNRAPGV